MKAVVGQLDAGESLSDNYIALENRLAAEKWVSCGLVLLESFLPRGSILYKQLENSTSGSLQDRVGQIIGVLTSCRNELESGRADAWFVAFSRTACAEGIEHRVTGWIAPNGDFAAYAEGLSHYFAAWKSGVNSAFRTSIAVSTADRYQTDALVKEICRVYSA